MQLVASGAIKSRTQVKNFVESGKYFTELLENHPEYLPTYYHAAYFMIDQGDLNSAKNTFQKGIELAKEQNDQKAVQELQNALQNLLFEMD